MEIFGIGIEQSTCSDLKRGGSYNRLTIDHCPALEGRVWTFIADTAILNPMVEPLSNVTLYPLLMRVTTDSFEQ